MTIVDFIDLGQLGYQEAWDLQKLVQASIIAEKRDEQSIGKPITRRRDLLMFVEHPHVYTLGKSGKSEHLLADEDRLRKMGATFVRNDRGGDITYHGPGQITGYPILDLDRHFTDIHRYLRTLEEMAIRTCADFGLKAGRIDGLTGAWIGDAKICAFGVKCSRWVTMHGFAFNVDPDLAYYDAIVPCGIRDHSVTSLAAQLGEKPDIQLVKRRLRYHFADLFEVDVREVPSIPERVIPLTDFN